MNIEEKILNDNSCSPYVDKGRGYVAFKDGAYWGYEKGCKDMIEKACEWMKEQVYQEYGGGPLERLIPDTRIADFRKAMEE